MYLFYVLATLGLPCCTGSTLCCSTQASHSCGFSCCEAQAPSLWVQQVGYMSVAAPRHCGIFPDLG